MAGATGQAVDLREPGSWRRAKNQVMIGGMWLAFAVLLVPLGFVLVTVVSKGASAISWQFLTNDTIPPNILPATVGGMAPRSSARWRSPPSPRSSRYRLAYSQRSTSTSTATGTAG